jgi:hypothetical protein
MASKAHIDPEIPVLELPTFTLDEYTVFGRNHGWLESGIASTVEKIRIRTSDRLITRKSTRMATDIYDRNSHPQYPYTHAVSAYSAVVQLYARSGQLPTRSSMHERGYAESNTCRFGCIASETPHHLFVQCEKYNKWREEASGKLEKVLRDKTEKEEDLRDFIGKAKSYFTDNDFWPLHISQYYLGHVPIISKKARKTIPEKQLESVIHTEMHYAGIRLAARIWGDYAKIAAREKEESERRRS